MTIPEILSHRSLSVLFELFPRANLEAINKADTIGLKMFIIASSIYPQEDEKHKTKSPQR